MEMNGEELLKSWSYLEKARAYQSRVDLHPDSYTPFNNMSKDNLFIPTSPCKLGPISGP